MNELNYTAHAPLCACGNTVTKVFKSGKPLKYCEPCRDKQLGYQGPLPIIVTCATCAAQFNAMRMGIKYCSKKCKWTARDRLAGHQPRKNVPKCVCLGCSKEYKPRASCYTTYCSRDCAFAHKAATPYSLLYAGNCVGCGAAFVSRRKRAYCSEQCWPQREVVSVAPTLKRCRGCEADYAPSYTGGRVSEYCGAACRANAESAVRRAGKAKRKAVIAGAFIERVDPFAVFDRDRWTCQLCGVRTPKAKRGSYEDSAPELDHITPLSRGGEHSYRNTQCACRKCNGEKSNTPRGQLLMFG